MELAFKNAMKTKLRVNDSPTVAPVSPKLERELARVEVRRNRLWAQLAEHTETMNTRVERGAPIKRLLAQHERMRERYCVVENRRQELLAAVPVRPAQPEDF